MYAKLTCVSLWKQCDIPHSGIVCDITPLQNFFVDITPVVSKAYVTCSTLSHGIFMPADQNIFKQRSYLLFLPNSMPFIINYVILNLQLDRDMRNYMNSMT